MTMIYDINGNEIGLLKNIVSGKIKELWGARLAGANLEEANLTGADLEEAILEEANLTKADLEGSYLKKANLRGANLKNANLEDANLRGANLFMANLGYAYLFEADLRGANLTKADLEEANLKKANLAGANLTRANLENANLTWANITGANLEGSKLPDFLVVPKEGEFIGWKRRADGAIVKLLVPEDAKRTNSPIGRKCRASKAIVLEVIGGTGDETYGTHYKGINYEVGNTVVPDSYDDDIRIECTNGIHFFMTREEAEDWS